MSRLAARQHRVLSIAELHECGLSDKAVLARVRRGWLHPRFRGVYAVGTDTLSLEGVFLAAVKACGTGAVLSHYAAAALHGIVGWDYRAPEVTVRGRGTRVHEGIRVHRSETDEVTRRSGIPVTTPTRTLVDLAGAMPYDRLRRAVRQALSLKLIRLPQLIATGRPGAKKLARIVANAEPTRNDFEDLVLDLILIAGFERPEVNKPLVLDGRQIVPDFRWPQRKLVVEADSAQWHDNKLAREDDAERQALLEAHGDRVMRITWRQAVGARGQTLRRLQAARDEGT